MVVFHALRGLALLQLVLTTAQAARKRSPIGTSNMTQVEGRDHVSNSHVAESDVEEAVDDAPTLAEVVAEEADEAAETSVGLFVRRRRRRARRRGDRRRDRNVSNSHVAEADVEEAVDDAPTLAEVVAEEADEEAAETSVGLFVRRRRRRARRRRDRRRLITSCNRNAAVVSSLNRCCTVEVEGHWSTLRAVSASDTITISYGYLSNVQTFDLVSVYQSAMVRASAGFFYGAFGGSAAYSGSTASAVVSSVYTNTAINFNLTWTSSWTNLDGRYLYQWVWTVRFKSDPNCAGVADSLIGTSSIVQADTNPKCLPGTNLDGKYQQCYPEGLLP